MTAVYLAGPYAARARLNGFAEDLRALGADVTASWLDETHDITPGTVDAETDLSDTEVARHAATDLQDIANADLLILITAKVAGVPGAASGGRHVETGFALAHGLPVFVVGQAENVFHRLGDTHGVYLWPDWITTLAAVRIQLGPGVGWSGFPRPTTGSGARA